MSKRQLWIDHPDVPAPGHRFGGYYFTYPSEEKHLGLVSTIADDPPMLNWLFVDKDTGAVRHGGRKDTLEHLIGPWGWSDDETWLTLEGKDFGFVAVEDEETGKWCIFLDRDQHNGGERRVTEDEGGGMRIPVKLRRKMALGMESKYVRPDEKR